MFTTWMLIAVTAAVPSDVQTKFIGSGATAKAGGYRPIRAEMSADRGGDIGVEPEGLEAPKYGKIVLGDLAWSFIVDERTDGDQKLYVDTNGDGDLTNDPDTSWSPRAAGAFTQYQGTAKVGLGGDRVGSLGMYRFDPTDPSRAALKDTLLYYTDFGYEVTVTLDDKPYTTFISGEPAEGTAVWLDRDGNGNRSYKLETLTLGTPFNFTGTTYVLGVTDGNLALTEADTPVEMTPLPPDLRVGKTAIPFEVKALDGSPLNFPTDYQGKIVMLDFWATWCGPCIAELPNVKAAYAEWHDEGFEVVGISFDREGMAARVQEFTAKNEMPWAQVYEGKYWDTDLGTQYDVSSIPFVLLVDGDTGEILATREQLRGPGLSDFIGQVLAERKAKE